MNREKRCYECAMCSEHYPSMKDICDVDEHEIKDVFIECCGEFTEILDIPEMGGAGQ